MEADRTVGRDLGVKLTIQAQGLHIIIIIIIIIIIHLSRVCVKVSLLLKRHSLGTAITKLRQLDPDPDSLPAAVNRFQSEVSPF